MLIILPPKAAESKNVLEFSMFVYTILLFESAHHKIQSICQTVLFPLFLKISSEWADIFLFYNHRERNSEKGSSLLVVSHQLIELFYGILEGLRL